MSGNHTDEERAQYLRTIFDAIPLPTFIVDEEVRIEDFNFAAEHFLGPDAPLSLHRRGGEAFHCLNSQLRGCGNAEPCRHCLIRNSVGRAIRGRTTHQEMHKAELVTPHGKRSIDLLITASLLPYAASPRVLLILEDVSEITALRGLVSGAESTRTGTA